MDTTTNIAIVWGGYSSEKIVSKKSAAGIYSFLETAIPAEFAVYKVKIDHESWDAEIDGQTYDIDKSDFSICMPSAKIKLYFAYITIHGTPGEDGILQGYFDMLGIPYSNCGVLASALTFNKYVCNHYLKSFGIRVAESVKLTTNKYNSADIINRLGLPVFVKPNVGGSSFATTKVKAEDQLDKAIQCAFGEGNEVMIESFIDGTEVTCGCYKLDNKFVKLPITEVVTKNEFFDYNAKYNGEVDEITPARIADDMAERIQRLTRQIYDLVGAKGIIRVDYIISNNEPILLEVNTTPGMTPTSFIPQQVAAANKNIGEELVKIIRNELSNHN